MTEETTLPDALADIMKVVHETIRVVGERGMENDKSLLKLSEVMAERVMELEQRVFHLESKVEILHEIYHTHFGDITVPIRH